MEQQHDIRIPLPPFTIRGTVELPEHPTGLVVFAQASAAHHPAQRDQAILDALAEARIGGARLDLIMPAEGEVADDTRLVWSDIHFLAGRLAIATDWFVQCAETLHLPIGYFGAGANAAVALLAAAARPLLVKAVVTCDGRPDLIGPALRSVVTPTLFLVQGNDPRDLKVNRRAMEALGAVHKALHIFPDDERDRNRRAAFAETVRRLRNWFTRFMSPPVPAEARPSGDDVSASPDRR